MKSRAERLQWIIDYITKRDISRSGPYTVDVLDAYFVDDYADFADAKCTVMPFGAAKCPQLGRDLTALHKEGKLKRNPTGLWNMAGMGFPRWVYTYKLADRSHIKD